MGGFSDFLKRKKIFDGGNVFFSTLCVGDMHSGSVFRSEIHSWSDFALSSCLFEVQPYRFSYRNPIHTIESQCKKSNRFAAIHIVKTLVTMIHKRVELVHRVFAVFVVRELYCQLVFPDETVYSITHLKT